MTGNVVFLGFALAGEGDFVPLPLIVALVGFLFGPFSGGKLVTARQTTPLRAWLVQCAALESFLIFITAALIWLSAKSGNAPPFLPLILIFLLSLSMGLHDATVRRLGVADMTTTVLTLTLTGLAADSGAAGGRSPSFSRRMGAVAAIFEGAFIGAVLIGLFGAVAPLLLAGSLTMGGVLIVQKHPALSQSIK